MAADIVTIWGNYVQPQYQYCGLEKVSRNVSKRMKQYTVYPKESRPKPEDLIVNQTPLAERYTIDYSNARGVTLTASVRSSWCYDTFGYFELSGNPFSYTVPNTNWELMMRLKIKSEYINLGNHLAEYRETTRSFLTLAKECYRYMQYLKCMAKKRNRKACRKWLPSRPNSKTPSSVALALDFGILPLANDLADGLYRMNEKYSGRPLKKRFSVIDRKRSTDIDYQGARYQVSVSERGTFHIQFESDIKEYTFGLPPEVLYEATFLSFVVDWVIPIGDYLQSLDALKGVEWMKGSVTKKVDVRCDVPGKWVGYEVLNNPSLNLQTFQRTIHDTVPWADLPTYQPSTSLRNVWQGLNLLNALQDYFVSGRKKTAVRRPKWYL